jgi:hypothetical protein
MKTAAVSSQSMQGSMAPALPFIVAAVLYAVLLAAGAKLLNDPDTYWHITSGQWILAHGFPHADPFSFTFAGKPWIAKEWLSQVVFAEAFGLGGWTAVVVVAAAAFVLAFALLAGALQQRLASLPTLGFLAAAFMVAAPHATARPHILALPVMIVWVASLFRLSESGRTPPYVLLPLMTLWANLHGSFLLGLLAVAAVGVDACANVDRAERSRVAIRWATFGILAVVAACITPYGPDTIFAALRVLGLGSALSTIGEWQPAKLGDLGGLELALLAATGMALWRGVSLPPLRIAMLLGLAHMALSAARYGETFGMLAPVVVAAPLASQFAEIRADSAAASRRVVAVMAAMALAAAIPVTLGLAALNQYRPSAAATPQTALAKLEQAGAERIFNDYDFGGYMISAGVPTFIDGRTELFGAEFTQRYYRAATLADVDDFLAQLDEYRIDATLLHAGSPAAMLLDRQPGWKRVYADDVAIAHQRLTLRSTLSIDAP